MGRNGIQWDAMGDDEMQWDVMGHNGMRWNTLAHDGLWWDGADRAVGRRPQGACAQRGWSSALFEPSSAPSLQLHSSVG